MQIQLNVGEASCTSTRMNPKAARPTQYMHNHEYRQAITASFFQREQLSAAGDRFLNIQQPLPSPQPRIPHPMSYPLETPAPKNPYKDRRASPKILCIDGLLLIVIGLVGGFFTAQAPAFLWVLSLAVIGAVVWAVGQIRETLECPYH